MLGKILTSKEQPMRQKALILAFFCLFLANSQLLQAGKSMDKFPRDSEKDTPSLVPLTKEETPLEMLTTDLLKEILKFLNPEGQRNLRMSCTTLFQKATPLIEKLTITGLIPRSVANAPLVENLRNLQSFCTESKKNNSQFLLSFLPKMTNLEILNLRAAGLNDASIEALAPNLPVSLQHLDLSSNEIGDPGFLELATALPNLKNLQSLDLLATNIKDDGAIALATALQHLEKFSFLRMVYSHVRDAGALALFNALKDKKDIRVYLHNNNVSKEVKDQIKTARPDWVI